MAERICAKDSLVKKSRDARETFYPCPSFESRYDKGTETSSDSSR